MENVVLPLLVVILALLIGVLSFYHGYNKAKRKYYKKAIRDEKGRFAGWTKWNR